MAARKRTTLPKEFRQILQGGDLDAMKAVFDACDVNARLGSYKQSALAQNDAPEELIRWLVEQGADIEATDTYGETPLHAHANRWNGNPGLLVDLGAAIEAVDSRGCTPLHHAVRYPKNVRALLERGADATALDGDGRSPLARALIRGSNSQLAELADSATMLLAAGDTVTEEMRKSVASLGAGFEEMRSGFAKDSLDATDAAMKELYAIAAVEPAPARVFHDGVSPIIVTGETTKDRFAALWEALVPPSGGASTVQGEVIRVVGRLRHEILGNGGGNWDRDFSTMVRAFPDHLSQGIPLAERREAKDLAKRLRGGAFDEAALDRLRELAIAWVALNPQPIPLKETRYRR